MKSAPSALLTAVLIIGIWLFVAANHGDAAAAVIGLILGIVCALLYRTRYRLSQLQQQLETLEQRIANAASSDAKTIHEPVPKPGATESYAAPVVAAPAPAVTTPPAIPAVTAKDSATPAAAVVTTPAVQPPLPAAKPPRPEPPPMPPADDAVDRALAAFVAWLKRGNPLARAGVVILFFGGSFLAKYAAEHSMFPIELRMAALALGTLALLGIGWRLREAKPLYSQTLQGGGIAGFYLTVFASTRLYQLLPHELSLGLLIVVAIAAAILAVAQNALALAVLGTGGGFLAPILLSNGGGSLTALFVYYTILNLGVFTVAWFRAWRVLNLLGFVFTFGIAGLFRASAYTAAQQPTMEFFLWLFFLLYVAVSILFSLRQKPDLKGYVSASLVFGLPLAVFTLHTSVVGHEGFTLAFSALGLAVFYLLLASALYYTRRDNLRLLCEAFAALGVIFATLAIPLGFDRQATALAWSVEGAGLVWLGVRQDRRLARAFGLLLQLAACLSYFIALPKLSSATPVLNGQYIGSLAIAAAGLLSGWWLYRGQTTRADYEEHFDSVAALWGIAWWLFGGLAEIQRHVYDYEFGGRLAFAAATVAALSLCGPRLRWPLLWRTASVLLGISAALALMASVWLGHPSMQAGWAGWPLLVVVAYAMLAGERQWEALELAAILPWLHALSAWLLVLLLSWEASWQLDHAIGGVWGWLPPLLLPAVALLFLSRRRLWPTWPLARHEDSYRVLTAVPLALTGLLCVLMANLGSDGDPVELIYLPLLNPLDISVLLVLLAVGRYWASLDAARRERLAPQDPRVLPGLMAALTFLWINAALIRALHYLAQTPLEFDGVMHSILVQSALSILWGVLGLVIIVTAARRHRRDAWFVGAALMAALVAKLFLVDTAGRGTVARIASFLVVGVLLLVAGYLSPLPPQASTGTGSEGERAA
jgi:uncharacterized membrane protein